MAPSTDDTGAISDWFEERPINKANRQILAHTIRSKLDFVGVEWAKVPGRKEVRMLDYACGPGFLSKV
jgi:2-polyprenyl-3-methyl-5-hydroxy-6-metoxy-1,4-benzoquinol methylase